MRITLLGTSSAVPTFRRSLSGTLLERDGEAFLLDCGEGTQFQLMRAGARRGHIGTILLTHLHGDHCYGLAGLLSSMNLNQREKPLLVIGPRGTGRWVEFIQTFPRPMRFNFEIRVKEIPDGYVGDVLEGQDYVVRTRPLLHRLPSQGYRFEEKPLPGRFDTARAEALGIPFGPDRGALVRGESVTLPDGSVVTPDDVVGPPRPGKVFVYCTDTGFCLEAKRLAQDADLLIHEATFSDAMHTMAWERTHSTLRQAATVAKAARVKRFVATHFSTRFDRDSIKELEKEGREVFPDLVMAKDLDVFEI